MADTKSQDAIALLKEDHRTVEKLFKDFEDAKGEGRKEKLARQICLELSVHTTIEEKIFYPACEGTVEEDLLKESYVEHDAAKLLIAEIEAASGESDEYFDSKVKVLPKRSSTTSRKRRRPAVCFPRRARASSIWTRLASSSRRGRRS